MAAPKRLVFVVSCLAFLPASTYAQTTLAGVVRDTSGGVLPGVSVEASSPALIERARIAVTDGSGQYQIVDLRPGTYALTFTLTGFSTVKRDGVDVTGSGVVTINADLRVGTVSETITVTGETPVVDIQTTRHQAVLNETTRSTTKPRNFRRSPRATGPMETATTCRIAISRTRCNRTLARPEGTSAVRGAI